MFYKGIIITVLFALEVFNNAKLNLLKAVKQLITYYNIFHSLFVYI